MHVQDGCHAGARRLRLCVYGRTIAVLAAGGTADDPCGPEHTGRRPRAVTTAGWAHNTQGRVGSHYAHQIRSRVPDQQHAQAAVGCGYGAAQAAVV
jgi:hypothetical protein